MRNAEQPVGRDRLALTFERQVTHRLGPCIASGPRRSAMMVESTTSQNSTVTRFSSPSCAVENTSGLLWARAGSGAPHWPQNLFCDGLSVWQLWHETSNGAAHSLQNLIPV